MAILISLTLFVLLMSAISYFGYRRYARPGRVYEQLGGAQTFEMPSIDRLNEDDPGLVVRRITPDVIQKVMTRAAIDPNWKPSKSGDPPPPEWTGAFATSSGSTRADLCGKVGRSSHRSSIRWHLKYYVRQLNKVKAGRAVEPLARRMIR